MPGVSLNVLIELGFLGGRAKLTGLDIGPAPDLGAGTATAAFFPNGPAGLTRPFHPARIHWCFTDARSGSGR